MYLAFALVVLLVAMRVYRTLQGLLQYRPNHDLEDTT